MPLARAGREAATSGLRRRVLPAFATAVLADPRAAAARDEVDLLLALAVDASGSIDADEFRLQREGYAEALSHPAVLAAIASKPRGAVAVAMADGPRAGLALIDGIEGLDGYHLLHASRAELLLRAGDRAGAHAAFQRARGLATNPAEQRHLDRRLASSAT